MTTASAMAACERGALMGLFDRLFPSSSGNDRSQPSPGVDPYSFAGIPTVVRPWVGMRNSKRQFVHQGLRSQHLGSAAGQWMLTRHEGHALVLAPSRSAAGKTTGVIVPNIVSMEGPVVVTSTKDDVVRATSIARAKAGRVWCYAPDGDTPIPPGLTELRWSPLTGAKDWGVALRTAKAMTNTMTEGDRLEGAHWKDRAGDVLSSVLHWAAITDQPMQKACDAVLALHSVLPIGGEDTMLGDMIADDLRRHPDGHPTAVSVLRNLMATQSRELSSIVSTAARALQVYQFPGAIRSTEGRNFDPMDFVRRRYGQTSTIYIISSGENQRYVAPLVVGLLDQIRRAQYTWVREYDWDRFPYVQPGDWTTTFVLDEMANIAPLPEADLVSILSEGGSQGLLLMAAIQDLALAESRWRTTSKAFLTLFGDVLVFPGIRDGDTLEAVSRLIGDYDAPTQSMSYSSGQSGVSQSHSTSYQRRRKVPPETVHAGIDPTDERAGIQISTRGIGKITSMPYWDTTPWPQVLASCVWEAANGHPPEWLWGKDEAMREEEPLTGLLLPDLRQWAANSPDDPWAARYLECRRTWDSRRAQQQRPRVRTWVTPEPASFPVQVTDEDLRLLASGAWTPAKEVLADIWGTHRIDRDDGTTQLASEAEAEKWRWAREAAATVWWDRTILDKAQIAWAVQTWWHLEVGTALWVRELAGAEMNRRTAAGDTDSVARYQKALSQATGDACTAGSDAWHARRMEEAVLERRPDSPAREWASMVCRAFRELQVGFILRRDLAADGQPQPDDDGRLDRLATTLDAMLAEANRLVVPDPVARFDWDAAWGPEDDEAMAHRHGPDAPFPETWHTLVAACDAALCEEAERRRTRGDAASVERYERTRAALTEEMDTNPSVRERARWEAEAAALAGQDWGWWKWWFHTDLVRLDQAFLLGKD